MAGLGGVVIVGRVSVRGGTQHASSLRGEVTRAGRYGRLVFLLSATKTKITATMVFLRNGEATAGRASTLRGLRTLRRTWSGAPSVRGTRSDRSHAGRLLVMVWSVCLAARVISAISDPMATIFGTSAARHFRSIGRIAICGPALESDVSGANGVVNAVDCALVVAVGGRVTEVTAAIYVVDAASRGCLLDGYSATGCSPSGRSRAGGITASDSKRPLITYSITTTFSSPNCSSVSASRGRLAIR